MPVTYALDSKFLRITASGQYQPADIPQALVAGLDDPAGPRPASLILDVCESEVLAGRTPDQIRIVAEALMPFADRIARRCAVVVCRDVQFGMARMGSVYSEGVGVQTAVFRTTEEAEAWHHAAASRGGRASR